MAEADELNGAVAFLARGSRSSGHHPVCVHLPKQKPGIEQHFGALVDDAENEVAMLRSFDVRAGRLCIRSTRSDRTIWRNQKAVQLVRLEHPYCSVVPAVCAAPAVGVVAAGGTV